MYQIDHMIKKTAEDRFWEIDFLRGTAIILMIIFHFIYDLNHLKIIYYKLWEGPCAITAKIVASFFLFLVGISLTISFNKSKQHSSLLEIRHKLIIRAGKLLFIGILITIISWILIPERFVIFGILHCIGVSIILSIPFLPYIIPNVLIGITLIISGIYLQYFTVDFPWLIPLGFVPPNYFYIDFFPLLPWFGVVLVGIALGNYLYPQGQRRYHMNYTLQSTSKRICFIGRHSLPIYVLHQPVLFGFIYLIFYPF